MHMLQSAECAEQNDSYKKNEKSLFPSYNVVANEITGIRSAIDWSERH